MNQPSGRSILIVSWSGLIQRSLRSQTSCSVSWAIQAPMAAIRVSLSSTPNEPGLPQTISENTEKGMESAEVEVFSVMESAESVKVFNVKGMALWRTDPDVENA